MTDWQTGIRAFREGRLREAVDRLKSSVEDTERTVALQTRIQSYAYLGAALYAMGKAKDAITAFEPALRLSGSEKPPTDLRMNLANAYLAAGRRDDAIAQLGLVIDEAPGHVEAQMLVKRLRSIPADAVSGTMLGESAESVKKYLDTLTFSKVAQGGYNPAEVNAAMAHVKRYIDFLDERIQNLVAENTRNTAELDRLRQTEEALVENLLKARQEADLLRQSERPTGSQENGQANTDLATTQTLTPIEILFQKKA